MKADQKGISHADSGACYSVPARLSRQTKATAPALRPGPRTCYEKRGWPNDWSEFLGCGRWHFVIRCAVVYSPLPNFICLEGRPRPSRYAQTQAACQNYLAQVDFRKFLTPL